MVWQGEGPLVEGDVAAAVDRLIVMVVVGCGDCNGYGGTTAVGTAAAVVVVVAVAELLLLELPLLWWSWWLW